MAGPMKKRCVGYQIGSTGDEVVGCDKPAMRKNLYCKSHNPSGGYRLKAARSRAPDICRHRERGMSSTGIIYQIHCGEFLQRGHLCTKHSQWPLAG
jgi:hypothetical protein